MLHNIEPFTRRAFDALFALGVILVLAPLFGLIALCILIEDGRPVLFLQERVGARGNASVFSNSVR